MTPPGNRSGYSIAIICALPMERAAVEAVLDKDYLDDPDARPVVKAYGVAWGDENHYIYGELAGKPVAMVTSPDTGTLNVALAASSMRRSFPNIAVALVVGITGGTPFKASRDQNGEPVQSGIRLGDVIISDSMFEYDSGKQYETAFVSNTDHDRRLSRAAGIVRGYIVSLRGRSGAFRRLREATNEDLARYTKLNDPEGPDYTCPGRDRDHIYPIETIHRCPTACAVCDSPEGVCDRATNSSCEDLGCKPGPYLVGEKRPESEVFIGPYVAGSGVMKSARKREQLVRDHGALAIEMEGAGVWNVLPTIVVKAVVDYADSHKNKVWREYPAARAALCAKGIVDSLNIIAPPEIPGTASASVVRVEPEKRSEFIPFPRNVQFVGRQVELEILKRRLFTARDCQKFAVDGLGGMGKTQLVLNFAYWVIDQHPDTSVFWIPALSAETFERATKGIAEELGIRSAENQSEDSKELVRRYLSTRKAGKWLLVVDNADDLNLLEPSASEAGLLRYLPESPSGTTVFTTRTSRVAQVVASSDVLRLAAPQQGEAVELLRKALRDETLLMDTSAVTDLLVELERLPLAISQAAAYINVNHMSLSDYTRLLQSTDEDLVYYMSQGLRDNMHYDKPSRAVATTWMVSFTQIQNSDAADLLRFISCIEWKGIPRSILPDVQPERRMMEAIGTLCSYSFLSKQTDGSTYDMHRLVHLASRNWLRKDGRTAEAQARATKRLAEICPFLTYGAWEKRESWRAYLPHATRLRSNWDFVEDSPCRIEDQYSLCLRVGVSLCQDWRYVEGQHWLKQGCQLTSELARDHPNRLCMQRSLAEAYSDNGQAEEAIQLLEPIVAIETLAEDDRERQLSQHALATSYQRNGQMKEAIQLFKRMLTQETAARDDTIRLAVQRQLARAYGEDGQTKDAVQLLEHIVAIRGMPAEDKLTVQRDLAMAYHANGQPQDALKLLRRVVDEWASYPETHTHRLSSQYALATAWMVLAIEPVVI